MRASSARTVASAPSQAAQEASTTEDLMRLTNPLRPTSGAAGRTIALLIVVATAVGACGGAAASPSPSPQPHPPAGAKVRLRVTTV